MDPVGLRSRKPPLTITGKLRRRDVDDRRPGPERRRSAGPVAAAASSTATQTHPDKMTAFIVPDPLRARPECASRVARRRAVAVVTPGCSQL